MLISSLDIKFKITMEFVNSDYCGSEGCNCVTFVQDMLSLCKELLAIEDVSHQCMEFQRFKRQFLRDYKFIIKDETFKMCSSLLDGIEKLVNDGLTLPTLLVDLMSVIYFDYGGKIMSLLVKEIHETHFFRDLETVRALSAFRTKSDFMNVLLEYNYISSLGEESYNLKSETYRIFVHFM